MTKLLSVFLIVLMLLLFPPTVLALISSNAVPGDSTYQIKRTLEDGILLGASITPATKAMFSANRSNRRFDETKILIAKGNQNAGESLDELVFQTAIAASQIEEIKDPIQKEELKQQLTQSIQKYNQNLNQIQKQIEKQSPVPVIVTPTPVTPTPISTITPTPTSKVPILTSTPAPTLASTPVLTPALTLTPLPTSTPTPSSFPSQIINPTPVSGDNHPVSADKLDDAQKKLKEIQDELQRKKSNQNSDSNQSVNNQRENNKNRDNKNKDR